MQTDFKNIATVTMILFAVIDIVGSIPLIIDMKQKGAKIQPAKTTLVSLVIMISFLFLGNSILDLIGIDINSFAIAGSLVLFFLALEMILGVRLHRLDPTDNTVSIVPLAFPFIAGPGLMTAMLSLRTQYTDLSIVIAILLNLAVVYMVLRTTGYLEKMLGKSGIAVLRKIFGIILLAIAVKLFRTNMGI